MNFDKDERTIDRQYNNYKNYKSTRKWLKQEIKLKEAEIKRRDIRIKKLEDRINRNDAKLFFKYIDMYNHYLLDVVIDEEFYDSFKEMDEEEL